jgi:hypothetical protein
LAALQHRAIKEAALPTLWPNVFTTVAELNPASMSQVLGSVGGQPILLIALLGIVLLLFRKDEHGKRDATLSALLIIWFAGTMYMSLKGVRFTLLLGPAFAVAFGAGIGLLYQRISSFAESQMHLNKFVTGLIIVLIAGLIIVNPVKAGTHLTRNSYQIATSDVPIMNDAWWNSLAKIKEISQPDAIVNSWWDFGHHFKYVADRAVTFDGASQNSPQAHWVGRVLQTDNEDEAVAILRMLDCGANLAFDAAFNSTKDPLKAVKLVKEIIMQNEETAAKTVQGAGVPADILRYTHCEAPEDYFIASGDMIGKAGVWSHFGLWSFDKAEVWFKWRHVVEKEAVEQMVARFNISEETAREWHTEANSLGSEEEANRWISPWPGFVSSDSSSCENKDDVLLCGNIAINMSSKHAEVRVSQGVALAKKVVVYAKDGSKQVLEPADGNSDLTIVVWPTDSGFNALAAFSQLADSLFTRLYYMGGLGLKHFRQVSAQSQLIGGAIYVYNVNWAGGEPFIPEELVPKSSVEPGAQVALNYIGWLDSGEVFDSSIPGWRELNITRDSGFDGFETKPLTFTAGKNQLVFGFENRIKGMKVSEMKTITVPPEEAYGIDPAKHPLGNKTLHFKVRIEAIR